MTAIPQSLGDVRCVWACDACGLHSAAARIEVLVALGWEVHDVLGATHHVCPDCAVTQEAAA